MSTTKNGFYAEMNHAHKPRAHRAGTGAKDTRNNRYADPWDNLLYAILLQAAIDSKAPKWGGDYTADANKFLQSDTARNWWEYLKKRPTY